MSTDTTTRRRPRRQLDEEMPELRMPPLRVSAGPTGVAAHAAPFAAMGVLVLASAALNAAQNATAADAEILGGTAATCVVIAVVAAMKFRQRLDDRRSAARAQAFIGLCATWLPASVMTDLTVDAVGVLVALGTALSLWWFRAKRIPNTRPPRRPVAEPPVAAPHVQLWAQNLAADGRALPGSRLTGYEPIAAGERYTLELVPGQQTLGKVMGILLQVRSGLKLRPEHDLIVEQHPDLDESCLRVTIVTRSPVLESQEWPGPSAFDPATGRIALGPFTDGEGVATWKAYDSNRLWGGFLAGGTGSGKSRMIEQIAFSLMASRSHPTTVFYADGQGGASSPLLVKSCDLAAITFEAIYHMLVGLELVLQLRQDENLVYDLEGFTPADDRTGILAFIDECQKVFSSAENPKYATKCQRIASTIAREGGKVGVALVLASQITTLDSFGNSAINNYAEVIRSNLLMGNAIIMRSKDANAKQVFGLDIAPRSFPAMPGYAYLVNPDPGARSAPFRGWYFTDEQRKVWPGRINPRPLDPGAATAYGEDYKRRRETVAQAKADALARIMARRSGVAAVAEEPAEEAEPQFTVVQFPTWPMQASNPAEPRPLADLGENHRAILLALEQQTTTPDAIARATGYSVRQVHNLLDELRHEFRLVRRAGRGTYVLAAADNEPPA